MVRLDVRREMGREVFASLRFDRQKAKCNDFGLKARGAQNFMEKEETMSKKCAPIIIEQAGMRMTVDHRRSGSGDEGLTFDMVVAGAKDEEKTILRFDCFYKNPHYHVGPSGKHPVHNMKRV